MNILMVPVTSSQIKSIGYDSETRTLYIEFSSGVVYEYYNVSPETYQAMLIPTMSVGAYFRENIRNKPDQLYAKTVYQVVDKTLIPL